MPLLSSNLLKLWPRNFSRFLFTSCESFPKASQVPSVLEKFCSLAELITEIAKVPEKNQLSRYFCQSGCEGPGSGAISDGRGVQSRAASGGGKHRPPPWPRHSSLRQTRGSARGKNLCVW